MWLFTVDLSLTMPWLVSLVGVDKARQNPEPQSLQGCAKQIMSVRELYKALCFLGEKEMAHSTVLLPGESYGQREA